MPEARVDAFRASRSFDPVCGGPVFDPGRANQFFDGRRTHYFCCAMCRRLFIDEWQALGGARVCRQSTAGSASSLAERPLRPSTEVFRASPRAPGAPPSPEQWSRDEAIGRLREYLLRLTDAEHSMCQVAAKLKIFCRGFCRWDDAEFRRRWQKVLGTNSGLTRAQLEELANLWQLTEQLAQRVALACDAQTKAHGACRGWDDFSNDEIARYCSDLLGRNLTIFEGR